MRACLGAGDRVDAGVGGMFTAQSIAPAFVNATARQAKGGAGALYLTFYYIGATIGSVLPGYGWQTWGWTGVVAICSIALLIALLADWALCREGHVGPTTD